MVAETSARAGAAGATRGAFWLYGLAVGAPIAAVASAAAILGRSPERLLRDTGALTGQPFYAGLFSNLGILAWWTAAATCLLAGLALWRAPRAERDVLLAGGVLSAYLGLDDLFQLHEAAFPQYLGVPEIVWLAADGLLTVAYLVAFARIHARVRGYGLLLSALVLFAVSAAVDILGPTWPFATTVEDGAKFAGICAWGTFHAVLAAASLSRRIRT